MDEDDDSSDFEEFPIVRPTRITTKEASDQSSSSALPSDKSSSKANDVVPCSSSSTESPADKTKGTTSPSETKMMIAVGEYSHNKW
mmetsp:Transcript_35157/g.59585  ORF Transcript_35157/g.59585 Transcript_35157/m.59585 type:complete len:86 (-) Transcript_35157:199-456(-)